MSNPMQAPQYPQAPQQPHHQGAMAPTEPAKKPGGAINLMYALLGIGIVSIVVDFVAGNAAMAKLGKLYKELTGEEIPFLGFNPGTMFSNLLFAIVIGVMAVLVSKGSNGARITGAVFAILFMIGGLGGIFVGLVNAGGADYLADQAGLGTATPAWYYLVVVVLGLAQFAVSLVAMILLFGKKAATYCKVPQA